MNQATGGMLIVVAEARMACKGEPDVTERIKMAMRVCHRHWMETNENNQFRAAIAAALLESPEAEKDRIQRSMASLNKVGAMLQALQAGVPVNLEAMADEPKEDDLIPLMPLWREISK